VVPLGSPISTSGRAIFKVFVMARSHLFNRSPPRPPYRRYIVSVVGGVGGGGEWLNMHERGGDGERFNMYRK
jgi:hypothetical protein